MKFEKIENSAFLPFYTNELWSISKSIVNLGNQLYSIDLYLKYADDNTIRVLSSISEIHEIISSILSHTSRLDKLLRSSGQRGDENEDAFNFRKERCAFLRKTFLPKKKNPFEIFKSSIRNGIEHFDERVDLMCYKIIAGDELINNKTLLCNITATNSNCFNNWDDVLPFKVFIINTGEYFMVDQNFEKQSILIYDILNEVAEIEKRCHKWSETRPDANGKIIQSPGGLLKRSPHELK